MQYLGEVPGHGDSVRTVYVNDLGRMATFEVAAACLANYRREFPWSVHDEEVLAQLARLRMRQSGCRVAVRWFREYIERYPSMSFATTASAHLRECA